MSLQLTVAIFDKSIFVCFQGPPEVFMSDLPESVYNECVQIKASIKSFPKYNCVSWFKGEEEIDIAQQKYEGSFHGADFSVLCINNVTKEDESDYTIKITNDLGNVNCSSNPLKVVGGISFLEFVYLNSFDLHAFFLNCFLKTFSISLLRKILFQFLI